MAVILMPWDAVVAVPGVEHSLALPNGHLSRLVEWGLRVVGLMERIVVQGLEFDVAPWLAILLCADHRRANGYLLQHAKTTFGRHFCASKPDDCGPDNPYSLIVCSPHGHGYGNKVLCTQAHLLGDPDATQAALAPCVSHGRQGHSAVAFPKVKA